MEYCCHVWAGAPSCYLEFLNKLKNRCIGMLVLHLLSLETLGSSSKCGIALVDAHLNWLNWFYFFVLEGGLLVIQIDCLIFLSPFLNVSRMSVSTVSLLAQLDSGILCL